MKAGDLFGDMDAYTRKARIYPALIAALPVAVFVLLLLPTKPLMALAPLTVSVGLMFLVSNVVRHMGKRLESKLVASWDGMPTTEMLRLGSRTPAPAVAGRRKMLETVTGTRLPNWKLESDRRDAADEVLVTATRSLISMVRRRTEEFPLVQAENIAYGYARNMLALKPIALIALSICLVADSLYYWRSGGSMEVWVVLSIHIIGIALWSSFVRRWWVRQAAIAYADRLFEALDQIVRLPDTSAPHQSKGSGEVGAPPWS
ncbi:hypothetical protein [Mangrovihabitans endophyticus]|uniref:Uncharacterized protein n=1 Tax=Mangrovihabitans endophyticus TaxID=1751298 RepID=A0A8J3FQ00_9ACTN|nr:hypothetical protein [Mangrovihabitans endophyticus]GGK94013.1 hypothetical protein GCM10012284_30100 [Mangrovihabitans endophyticus]